MNESKSIAVINERAELDTAPSRDEQMRLIRQTAGGGSLNDQEFALLLEIARRTGLDILRKQIYGVKYGGKMSIVVGVDGFRAVARRNGLAGISDVTYTYRDDDANKRWPLTATVTVRRHGPSGIEEYTATARWHEFAKLGQDGKPVDQWKIRPHIMLGKCAEVQAHRKGFSESLGALYAEEEFDGNESRGRVQQSEPRKLDEMVQERGASPSNGGASENTYDYDPTDAEAP